MKNRELPLIGEGTAFNALNKIIDRWNAEPIMTRIPDPPACSDEVILPVEYVTAEEFVERYVVPVFAPDDSRLPKIPDSLLPEKE